MTISGRDPHSGAAGLPLVAIVGRPNVGKSTLFNQLTGTRAALVADVPGLTRDRRYGEALIGDRRYRLVDTGGLFESDSDMAALMAEQVDHALADADLVLFIVDARAGVTVADMEISDRLRRAGRTVLLVINKVDGVDPDVAQAEFARLGITVTIAVSAVHRRNFSGLIAAIEQALPAPGEAPMELPSTIDARIRVAVIGRPNVGKSTLINRWLGEDRLIVYDAPGTTRDSIEVPFEQGADRFTLIDTAGVRRRGRVDEVVEKFSVAKSLEAIRSAHVVVLVVDASEGLVEQDLHLLGIAAEAGAGLVLAVNKSDALTDEQRRVIATELDRRLDFAPWVAVHRISARTGRGVRNLLREVKRVFLSGDFDVPTSRLNKILERAVAAHEPPAVRGRRIKLRFAHKAGAHPPRIVIHGNQTSSVPAAYTRYLENAFRGALRLEGTPIRIEYRTGENPYADRPNQLSERQRERRKRLIRHRKSRER
jgi:GTPase